MSNTNTILLKGDLRLRHDEALAGAALKPGHLMQQQSDGTVIKHNVSGGWAEKAVAKEDDGRGLTTADAYAAADPVMIHRGVSGDVLNLRLPASAAAVVVGDPLVSNGDGCVIKPLTTGSHTLYEQVAAGTALTNSTVETALSSYTIPANTLQVGDQITVKGEGIATATNSTDTLKVKLYIGSTAIFDSGALDVADNDIYEFEATIIIRTIGASGTLVAEGTVTIGTPGTSTVKAFKLASTAVDTTATQALTLKGTWSVANAGNSVRSDVFDVEIARVAPVMILFCAVQAVDNSGGSSEAFIAARII